MWSPDEHSHHHRGDRAHPRRERPAASDSPRGPRSRPAKSLTVGLPVAPLKRSGWWSVAGRRGLGRPGSRTSTRSRSSAPARRRALNRRHRRRGATRWPGRGVADGPREGCGHGLSRECADGRGGRAAGSRSGSRRGRGAVDVDHVRRRRPTNPSAGTCCWIGGGRRSAPAATSAGGDPTRGGFGAAPAADRVVEGPSPDSVAGCWRRTGLGSRGSRGSPRRRIGSRVNSIGPRGCDWEAISEHLRRCGR